MSASVKWVAVAALSGLVGAYFAVISWRATSMATVLMRAGYEAKGWTVPRLSTRIRLVGMLGLALALAVLVLSVRRAL